MSFDIKESIVCSNFFDSLTSLEIFFVRIFAKNLQIEKFYELFREMLEEMQGRVSEEFLKKYCDKY